MLFPPAPPGVVLERDFFVEIFLDKVAGQSTQIAVNVGEDLNSHASISVIIPSHLLVG